MKLIEVTESTVRLMPTTDLDDHKDLSLKYLENAVLMGPLYLTQSVVPKLCNMSIAFLSNTLPGKILCI